MQGSGPTFSGALRDPVETLCHTEYNASIADRLTRFWPRPDRVRGGVYTQTGCDGCC